MTPAGTRPRPRSRLPAMLIGTALAAAGAAIGVCFALYRTLHWAEIVSGWLLATSNGVLFTWISRRAVGREPGMFLVWALLMNGLRFLLLLLIIVGLWWTGWGHWGSFVISAIMGYFLVMAGEMTGLLGPSGVDPGIKRQATHVERGNGG
jgi:hypothetical protein